MTDNFRIEEAYQLLTKFESAEDLAGYFKALGIKAVPAKAGECAISQYMVREAGVKYSQTLPYSGNYSCAKMGEIRGKTMTLQWWNDNVWTGTHTPAMSAFINNFDNRRYPELEA